MKLIIVRHGDPNYELDALTEIGKKEAALAAEKLSKMEIDHFYVSPLGRAQETASYTLNKMKREAVTLDWLQEFQGRCRRPDANGEVICSWDWLPEDWTVYPEFYNINTWLQNPIMKDSNVPEMYQMVCDNFDKLLADHGYVREENYYRVENANHDTIVLFCHFGLECILLSRLLNISPMLLWHGFCAAPTSMTTIYTEERREGKAYFRVQSFGDNSHLYVGSQEPSFSARFCETFNDETRHD